MLAELSSAAYSVACMRQCRASRHGILHCPTGSFEYWPMQLLARCVQPPSLQGCWHSVKQKRRGGCTGRPSSLEGAGSWTRWATGECG